MRGSAGAAGDERRRLATLLDVNLALSHGLSLRSALHRTLEILERHTGVERAAITLIDQHSGQLHIQASIGINNEDQRARYAIGEGITGRVVQSGKPVVVPQVSREPLFLNRPRRAAAVTKRELSFICVPIFVSRKAVGTLAVDVPYLASRDYDRDTGLLRVIASMIGQAVRMDVLADAERQRLRDENLHLRGELKERYDFSNIVGTSGPMRQVYEQIAQVAPTTATVFIRGESGTGKELIAHAIHYNSPRASKPFIKVSAAALPESLIESELFGYEKGAFTGALQRKKGRFELADGGTLFLDEIGDLNPQTQVKLLRVLQSREFERVGGTEPIKANVRLIAATHVDLERAIGAGTFREDLYYRLNVFTIFVPPLRERKPDVMLLADHFLERYAKAHHKSIRRISTTAIDMLMSYHWPGNVRELENAIERAVLVCDEEVVHGHHLPPTLQTAEASGTLQRMPLEEAVNTYEKNIILDVLKTTRGNRAKAATLLGSTERIIRYKVKQYGIDVARFKK